MSEPVAAAPLPITGEGCDSCVALPPLYHNPATKVALAVGEGKTAEVILKNEPSPASLPGHSASRSNFLLIAWTYVSAILVLVDQLSDLVLAFQWIAGGDYIWGILTIIFALICPLLYSLNVLFRKTSSSHTWKALGQWLKLVLLPYRYQSRLAMLVMGFLGALLLPFILIFILVAPPAILIGGVIFEGMVAPVLCAIRYHKHPEDRGTLEAELRAFSLLEIVAEAIPQVVLQVYLYTTTDSLASLSGFQIFSISMSFLMTVKGLLMGDAEIHRGHGGKLRCSRLLLFLGFFRCVDVLAGVLCTVLLAIILKGPYFFLAYFASVAVTQTVVVMGFGTVLWIWPFMSTLHIIVICVCCLPAISPAYALFPLFFLFLGVGNLIPAIVVKLCGCGDGQRAVTRKVETESVLRLLGQADWLVTYAYWTALFGPSFMMQLRTQITDSKPSWPGYPDCQSARRTTIKALTCKGFRWIQFDSYPLFSTHVLVLVAGFVLSWLVLQGVITTDVGGAALPETAKAVSFVVEYTAIPAIVLSCILLVLDRSPCGHRCIRGCSPSTD